jgi:hypothetical protein
METHARHLAQVLAKTQDVTSVYLDLCQSDDMQKRQQAVDTILSWPELDFSNPEHPTLSYDIDLVQVFVGLGLDDASWALLQKARESRLLIIGMRTNRTAEGVQFQCQPRYVELEASFGVPPAVVPLDCP